VNRLLCHSTMLMTSKNNKSRTPLDPKEKIGLQCRVLTSYIHWLLAVMRATMVKYWSMPISYYTTNESKCQGLTGPKSYFPLNPLISEILCRRVKIVPVMLSPLTLRRGSGQATFRINSAKHPVLGLLNEIPFDGAQDRLRFLRSLRMTLLGLSV